MSSAGLPRAHSRRRSFRSALRTVLAAASALCLALAGLGSQSAAAANVSATLAVGVGVGMRCTIVTAPLPFGNYDPADSTPLDATGAMSLHCSASNFTIRIRMNQGLQPGPGSGNNNPVRQMSDGLGNFLGYNIYRNAARTQVWGGTNPTGVSPPNGPWPLLIPVYGRIPANQYVQSGSYADTVTVTVLF
jgi:spore coat protein U-like protein